MTDLSTGGPDQLALFSFEELEQVIERGLRTFIEVGQALLRIRDERLYYQKGYTEFDAYCRERWNFNRQRAHQLIQGAEVSKILDSPPKNDSQARELVPLLDQPDELAATWQQLREEHGDRLTAEKVREAVQVVVRRDTLGGTAAQLVASEENEWYTPGRYIEAARTVLGDIDLDPATSHTANETVKAPQIFTLLDDGLEQAWHGRVWLNPPYGRLAGEFITKLVWDHQTENVTAAVALVNAHCTDTAWFQQLWDYPLCFTDHRIDFDSGGRAKTTTSTHGSVFAYLGPDREAFADTFGQFGAVVRRWP